MLNYNVNDWKSCIGFVSGDLSMTEVIGMKDAESEMGEYVANVNGGYKVVSIPRVEWTAE